MGTLYLVRHGQASFGAADYDQLSPLGARQCEALGGYLQGRGLRFEAVLRGSLRRHVQSLAALQGGFGELPEALEWPGLNEYDGEALVRAVSGGTLPDTGDDEGYRQHFRLLRAGLQAWMDGRTQPEGLPPYADWVAGIIAALDHVRAQHGGDVLVVSSGGPIATAVAQVLAAPPASSIDLNMRIRNSSLTELAVTPRRLQLQAFNQVPHLDTPERRGWITHA
jgi:broad specificity phosphatase PhoE